MKRSNSNNNNKKNNIYNNDNIEIKRITPKSISLNKDRDRYSRKVNMNNYNALYTFNQKNIEKEQNNNKNNLFDEITNYEIESTSKNITESQRNTNKNKAFTYTEQLELKIQEQAKRLSDLSKYKILCEKRLRELNPNEKIPLTEDSIKTLSKKSSDNENEINMNKYNILYDKYQKLKKLYHELSKNPNNSNRSSNTNESNFNIEKYKKLKERYKFLKNENSKLVELLQKETITTEEQKNIISLLQQSIDNDLIKSGNINKYINSNNVFDLTKLKNEAEEYRKELILSQALVNSLKSEIEVMNKEKEEEEKRKKNTINLLSSSETFDNNSSNNKYLSINKNDNDNLFDDENNTLINQKNINDNENLIGTINSQKKFISEILKKNSELEQLVNNASYKLNEGINLNNDAKDKMKSFELEIQNKKNELSQYEEKFTYFNNYISSIKSSLSQLQNFLNDYVVILNKMANEDLNSHLTKNFSENVNLLKNKMSLISKVEKYNLDIDNDLNIINSAINTLTIINDEFVNIYEKIFQSDDYYKESNKKLENLQNEIDSTNQNLETQKENINFISSQLNQKLKENINIKQSNNNLNERNYNLNFEIAKLKSDINLINNDKIRLLDFIQIICKINSITDMKVSELIRQGISIIENIGKLREEKNEIERKLNNINLGNQKNIILSNNEKDLNKIICNEQNNLKQLINEIERKINENEIQFDELKKELNCLYNMYNSYGDNNNYICNNQYNNSNNNNIYQIKKTRPENLNGINSNFNKKSITKSNTENYNFTYGTTNTLEEQYKKYIDSHSNYNNTNNNFQNNCINYSNGNKMTYQVIQTTPH